MNLLARRLLIVVLVVAVCLPLASAAPDRGYWNGGDRWYNRHRYMSRCYSYNWRSCYYGHYHPCCYGRGWNRYKRDADPKP